MDSGLMREVILSVLFLLDLFLRSLFPARYTHVDYPHVKASQEKETAGKTFNKNLFVQQLVEPSVIYFLVQ